MSPIIRSIRSYAWPVLVLILGAIAISICAWLIPESLDPILWVASAVIGAVVSFLLAESLPEDFRVPVRYYINSMRKRWIEIPDVTITLLARYSLNKRINQAKLRDHLQSEFGTNPTGDTRFQRQQDTRLGQLNEVINLDTTYNDPSPSFVQSEDNIVESSVSQLQQANPDVTDIRVRLEIEANYKTLERALDLAFERYSEYSIFLSSLNVERAGYTFRCHMADPVIIGDFMEMFDMEYMKSMTQSGTEVEFREQDITIRNLTEEQLYAVKESVRKIVTYYG